MPSLGIHLPQCILKWEADEARRPDGQRRQPPLPPDELADPENRQEIRKFKDGVAEGVLPSHPADVDSFNERMQSYFKNSSLARCENCGRTFNWESLERHRKGCSSEGPGKAEGNSKSPPQQLSTDVKSSGSEQIPYYQPPPRQKQWIFSSYVYSSHDIFSISKLPTSAFITSQGCCCWGP